MAIAIGLNYSKEEFYHHVDLRATMGLARVHTFKNSATCVLCGNLNAPRAYQYCRIVLYS